MKKLPEFKGNPEYIEIRSRYYYRKNETKTQIFTIVKNHKTQTASSVVSLWYDSTKLDLKEMIKRHKREVGRLILESEKGG